MNSENTQAEPVSEATAAPECAEAMALATVSQEKITELENTIKANETVLSEVKTELEALKAEKTEYEIAAKKSKEDMEMKEEEAKKAKSELDAALEALAAYKAKEEDMLKKEKKMKRAASLIEAGVDSDTATSTVDKFESMDDDSFAALTVLLAAKKAKVEDKEDKMEEEEAMKMKMAKSSETVDASVLETAEVEEEVNLGVGGEIESAVEATRAALVEFVCSRLGKTL